MDHADRNLSTEGGAGKATVQIGKTKNKISVKLEPAPASPRSSSKARLRRKPAMANP
jgi:hypothetical protein